MSHVPLVSVLIPTYNCAVFLAEAIESVLQQTFTDYELIIVDNHSTDNTTAVVQAYLEDSRVSYYRNETNLGLVGNWNKCLGYAKGKYIKFLCADDVFHPQIIEKFVSVMESHPSVALVACYRREFGETICERDAPFQFQHDGKKIIFETLNDRNWLGEPTTVMFRKEDLTVGNFKAGYTWIVDWEMWLRILSKGDCYILPEYLSFIRRHPNQVTELVFKNYIHSFEEYELCKAVAVQKEYAICETGLDMNPILDKRAKYFRKIAIKLLPKLYKKDSRKAFKKALKILAERKAYT